MTETAKRTIRYDKDGVHILGVVNVAGSTNEGESAAKGTHVSSRQRVRIVQQGGKTFASEDVETTEKTEHEPGEEERK